MGNLSLIIWEPDDARVHDGLMVEQVALRALRDTTISRAAW